MGRGGVLRKFLELKYLFENNPLTNYGRGRVNQTHKPQTLGGLLCVL
jgi:hypothetical protein